MDTTKFSDPAIVGPGCWFKIHMDALHADTNSAKLNFIKFMTQMSEKFKCVDCRQHFKNYLVEHPPSDYFMKEQGMFIWAWEFHNAVNVRLHKPIITYEEALEYFSTADEGVCFDCGESSQKDVPSLLNQYVHKRFMQR